MGYFSCLKANFVKHYVNLLIHGKKQDLLTFHEDKNYVPFKKKRQKIGESFFNFTNSISDRNFYITLSSIVYGRINGMKSSMS